MVSENAFSLSATTMVDHFQILRPLGRGGMGEVYLARDIQLGRKVALKIIRSELSSSDLERFRFEARITARFNHPNIITIYGVGEFDGCPYIALEYLEGENLAERMGQGGTFSTRETIRIALSIVDALREAHGHKILHRDLKP
ncbi:serine/threonine protein kinase, partial [Myxococcota bacterium]|nr:serine/threonine protein kinase [Myxococcota bacterium]